MSLHLIKAVAKRDFTGYFRSPTAYVFITLFILLGAVSAFWQERFFANNLANLDTLNAVMPYLLLFFIPAVTMSAWASEKQHGTEELLLTLPARDGEVVLGKFLACVGIYTAALAFSLSHVVVLSWLGNPDVGLLAATYLGYWLLGAILIAFGMIGSLLTNQVTVGFILGAVLCAIVVFLDQAGLIVSEGVARLIRMVSPVALFQDLSRGVVSPVPLVCGAGFIGVALYVNHALLGRRLWRGGEAGPQSVHRTTRSLAMAVFVLSVTVLVSRTGVRWDWTAERLHSLSAETLGVLRALDRDRPIYVQAFVSPEGDVPQSFVPVRTALVGLLRSYEAAGRGAVLLNIRDTESYSLEAREAREQFGITPQMSTASKGGRSMTQEVYLGVVFTSGAEEVVIPFMHKGFSVEYELTRGVRVASRTKRLKVGVLATDAKLFGGLDFQSMSSTKKWSILEELAQQYDVVQVSPDADFPKEINVLMVAMLSSLTQDQMNRVTAAMKKGIPALLFDDALPLMDMSLVPGEPKAGGQRGMFGGSQPASQPKGDAQAFYKQLGLRWPSREVVWDSYNPHPPLAHLPPEVVFVGAKSGAKEPFHPGDTVTSGLQEIVLLFPGHLESLKDKRFEITPLLTGTTKSGLVMIQDVIQRGFFGVTGLNPQRPHKVDGKTRVFAVRVKGSMNAIVMADLDMISEEFFEIRKQGLENLEFDNVALVSNAVDVLAGDEAFVALRKRRKQHRTLEAVEAQARIHQERSLQETQSAEERATHRLKEAQASLNQKVTVLRARTDLDEQTKAIMTSSLEEVENRRLAVIKSAIEEDKKRAIEKSQSDMETAIRAIQRRIKMLAVALPPIPTLLLAMWVYGRKRRKERELIPADRMVDAPHPSRGN